MVSLPLQQVHCGCIVSSHAFTLLDPGGIECITCATKPVSWVRLYLAFPILFFDFGQLIESIPLIFVG